MADIIILQKARKERENLGNREINELLKQATNVLKEEGMLVQKKLKVFSIREMRRFFERKIAENIFASKLIESDILLCGLYVSKLLSQFALMKVEDWQIGDYTCSNDPLVLQEGGDKCFLVYGVFPSWVKLQLTNLSLYQTAGEGLYYRFYNKSGKEISYHMSRRFETMAQVVKNSLLSLE